MSVTRILNILNKDGIVRFREFLSMWWERASVEALLAPVELPDGSGAAIQVVEDPAELWAVNPFIPLMTVNSAALVSEFICSHPKGRLAAILRPCELSTLVELRKRNWFLLYPGPSSGSTDHQEVVTIGVDCTGTYGQEQFAQRSREFGREPVFCQSFDRTTPVLEPFHQALRLACQLCERPASTGADITIGSTGVAQEGHLLVIARNGEIDERLGLREVTDGMAKESVILRREAALAATAKERAGNWAQQQTPGLQQPGEISRFLASMTCCTLCADCLDACPLYHGELSSMLGVGGDLQLKRPQLSEWIEVNRWLASCSGCGMCAEACSAGVPLVPLILELGRFIRSELHYSAGNPQQPLPWSSPGQGN